LNPAQDTLNDIKADGEHNTRCILVMAVLTDDAAAHASDDELPAHDVREDMEGAAA